MHSPSNPHSQHNGHPVSVPGSGADQVPPSIISHASRTGKPDWRWFTALGKIFRQDLVLPAGESLGFEEVRKRKLFAVLIVPGILILLSFGLHHLFNGIWLEGSLDLIACLW